VIEIFAGATTATFPVFAPLRCGLQRTRWTVAGAGISARSVMRKNLRALRIWTRIPAFNFGMGGMRGGAFLQFLDRLRKLFSATRLPTARSKVSGGAHGAEVGRGIFREDNGFFMGKGEGGIRGKAKCRLVRWLRPTGGADHGRFPDGCGAGFRPRGKRFEIFAFHGGWRMERKRKNGQRGKRSRRGA